MKMATNTTLLLLEDGRAIQHPSLSLSLDIPPEEFYFYKYGGLSFFLSFFQVFIFSLSLTFLSPGDKKHLRLISNTTKEIRNVSSSSSSSILKCLRPINNQGPCVCAALVIGQGQRIKQSKVTALHFSFRFNFYFIFSGGERRNAIFTDLCDG